MRKLKVEKHYYMGGKQMANIFLSHSSKDKERYVRIVAEKLEKEFDEHSIHYDEHTFEAGMKSLEEIEKGLNILFSVLKEA